ncbi:MAG TPA: hypothetical protein VGK73_27030 [Polyangiaceae bacterium]
MRGGAGVVWAAVAAFAAFAALGCDSSRVLTLGKNPDGVSAPPSERPRFELVRMLDELSSDDKENDNPTLSGDLLQIFFSSERNEDATDVDVFSARRAGPDARFDAPEPVAAVNSDGTEASPAVSLAGTELWFAAERDPGVGESDVWYSSRGSDQDEWSEPVLVNELSSEEKDTPRPPGLAGRVMPLGSRALGSGFNATYLAERAGPGAPFGEPELVQELVFDEISTVDAFLAEDGLSLYFNLTPDAGEAHGDLFVARRPSLGEPFGEPEPLEELNTSGDERDPWLSPDGLHLFFSSDRDGTLNIYEAVAILP